LPVQVKLLFANSLLEESAHTHMMWMKHAPSPTCTVSTSWTRVSNSTSPTKLALLLNYRLRSCCCRATSTS